MKKVVIFLIIAVIPLLMFSRENKFIEDYLWVKKTIEENDAGFDYAIQQKGIEAYNQHNENILKQIKQIDNMTEFKKLLNKWLHFFRPGHIGIYPVNIGEPDSKSKEPQPIEQYADWEKIEFQLSEFRDYLVKDKKDNIEGIWDLSSYKIGIIKQENEYLGFIIEAENKFWKKGQIKLRIPLTKDKMTYYMGNHSERNFDELEIIDNAFIQSSFITLRKDFPKTKTNELLTDYFKSINAKSPYLKRLNENILVLRIPSFLYTEKSKIDSILAANKEKFTQTKNLIIDLRNNGGGSDRSFKEIIPLIYTNPIRTIGVEYLSTPLNNRRMEEFTPNSEAEKKWAQQALEKLNNNIGKFVNINDKKVSITKLDTIYDYPQNVGIIINEHNGSTTEQFLLAAKQSKKVKLFGVTTSGILDISNMYFVNSPDNDFKLAYCLSKSLRIPEMTIDNKGIQPDYYLDKSIPQYKWIEFVDRILKQ